MFGDLPDCNRLKNLHILRARSKIFFAGTANAGCTLDAKE